MNEFSNKIESELISLIEQRGNQFIISERDKPIDSIIVENYYHGTVGNQRAFKQAVQDLLFTYSTIRGVLADSVLYYLLHISLKVKIPIDNLITDVLKNKSMANRLFYENGYDLVLLALKLLIDVPISYRTQEELKWLIKNESFYRKNTSYCLHFIEIFGRKEILEGLEESLNSLLDLNISDSEINLVASQLKSTLRVVNPPIFLNWYNSVINERTKIRGNQLNKILLRFVEISETKDTFHMKDWKVVFNLIKHYSQSYSSSTITDNVLENVNEYFPNAPKAMAVGSAD